MGVNALRSWSSPREPQGRVSDEVHTALTGRHRCACALGKARICRSYRGAQGNPLMQDVLWGRDLHSPTLFLPSSCHHLSLSLRDRRVEGCGQRGLTRRGKRHAADHRTRKTRGSLGENPSLAPSQVFLQWPDRRRISSDNGLSAAAPPVSSDEIRRPASPGDGGDFCGAVPVSAGRTALHSLQNERWAACGERRKLTLSGQNSCGLFCSIQQTTDRSRHQIAPHEHWR